MSLDGQNGRLGDDDWQRADKDDWTPWRGVRRGALFGLIVAIALAIPMLALAIYAPLFAIAWVLRTPIAFGLQWILSAVVDRASGMVEYRTRMVAFALNVLLSFSQQVAIALDDASELAGFHMFWFYPASMLTTFGITPQAGIDWSWIFPIPTFMLSIVPCTVAFLVYRKIYDSM